MQSSKKKSYFTPLLENIGLHLKNEDLLKTAFVHTSYLNEHKSRVVEDNERLEFLGDAVLELVTTEYLFSSFPEEGEGQLTNFRSALVKGKHLSEVARTLALGDYLYLSRGEEQSGGRNKNYILANTLEALIGAIYLDCGFIKARAFIRKFILTNLGDILRKGLHVDAKSKLQENIQEKYGVTPTYRVLAETGPDHDKIFEVGAFMNEVMLGTGKGSSKQKAQEDAAMDAIQKDRY